MDPKTKILTHNNDSKKSIITPIYKTSTFVFDTAEDGEQIFKGQSKNFVYSRINHPNMITTEQKISIFDDSEDSALEKFVLFIFRYFFVLVSSSLPKEHILLLHFMNKL